jgi:surface polysaccharide O-acyltransferase-like enzyme
MERNAALDLTKLVLSIMVVGIHVRFLSDVDGQLSYLLCNGLFRVAVPIFFLINGFYFYSVAIKGTSRAWLARVAGLYAMWMLVYMPFWVDPAPSMHSVLKFGYHLLFGYHHLWYLPGMVGAAALVLLVCRLGTKLMLVLCVLSFALGVGIQYAAAMHVVQEPLVDKALSQVWVYRNALFFGFPFFGLGFLVAKENLCDRVSNWHALIAAVVGAVLLIAEVLRAYRITSAPPMDNLASLLLICPAAFVLVKKSALAGERKLFALMASGVYFSHVLILHLLERFELTGSILKGLLVVLLSLMLGATLVPLGRRFRYVL